MTRHIIITALCFIATAFTALASAPVERVDTLLFSPKASAIAISRYRTNTTIAVNNVDGSADNFYYQTGSSTRVRSDERSKINYTDITNVLIAETETKRLLVQFTTDKNHNVEYTYDLPDPDNRYVKTFLGDKSSDFGIQLGVNLGKSGGTRWDLVSGGWGAGWVGTLDCDPSMDASMWKSDEFTWAVVLGVRMTHGPHSLTAGLGIDWRNYVTTGDRYLHKDEEGRITLMPYEEGSSRHRSRIQTFSLQIPVLYGISFGSRRNFQFLAGPVLNFNTGGNIKTQYRLGSNDYSIKTRRIHQKPVTVDMMAEIKYKSVGIYVRYAPMEVLKSSTGLGFKSISTGIMLGL